jgi:protein-L-isoaspartate(D-aspartate) O-methyltransferase
MQTDFRILRVKMVDGQLRTTDVTNHKILLAFLTVPRELFVADAHRDLAYLDNDIQIAPGRYLMEPSPLAKLLQLAAIKSSDKVLIVGSSTGYSAAIVSQIAAQVVALESDDGLSVQAKSHLAALNISNVTLVSGLLQAGASSNAPYDLIVVEGAISAVPATLIDQLSNGGRLVVVEGQGLTGVAKHYVKAGKTATASRGFNLSVKPLPGFEQAASFVF